MNNLLEKMIKNAEARNKNLVNKTALVGGEIFERRYEIMQDYELTQAIINELSAVLSDLGEKYNIDVDELLINNLKDYHEELFEEKKGE